MTTLQAGLLNETEYIGEVIALAIQLLALALEDPGIPDNHPEVSPTTGQRPLAPIPRAAL